MRFCGLLFVPLACCVQYFLNFSSNKTQPSRCSSVLISKTHPKSSNSRSITCGKLTSNFYRSTRITYEYNLTHVQENKHLFTGYIVTKSRLLVVNVVDSRSRIRQTIYRDHFSRFSIDQRVVSKKKQTHTHTRSKSLLGELCVFSIAKLNKQIINWRCASDFC